MIVETAVLRVVQGLEQRNHALTGLQDSVRKALSNAQLPQAIEEAEGRAKESHSRRKREVYEGCKAVLQTEVRRILQESNLTEEGRYAADGAVTQRLDRRGAPRRTEDLMDPMYHSERQQSAPTAMEQRLRLIESDRTVAIRQAPPKSRPPQRPPSRLSPLPPPRLPPPPPPR